MRALLVIACLLLGAAMFAMPYGFYTLLRLWLCVVGGLLCYRWVARSLPAWVGVGGLLCAVLYNPLVPVYLSRDIWLWINIVSLVFMLLVVLFVSGRLKLIFGLCWVLIFMALLSAYVWVGSSAGFTVSLASHSSVQVLGEIVDNFNSARSGPAKLDRDKLGLERWMIDNGGPGSEDELQAWRDYEFLGAYDQTPTEMVPPDQYVAVKAARERLGVYTERCIKGDLEPFAKINEYRERNLDGERNRMLAERSKFFEVSFDGKMGEGKAMMDGYFGEEDYGAWPDNVKNDLRAHQLVVDYLRFRGVPSAELADGGISYIRQMSLGMDGVERGFEATGVYNALSKEIQKELCEKNLRNRVREKVYKLATRGYSYCEALRLAAIDAKLTDVEKARILPRMRLYYAQGEFIAKLLKSKIGLLRDGVSEYGRRMDSYLWGGMFSPLGDVSGAAVLFVHLGAGEERRAAVDILRDVPADGGCDGYGVRLWSLFNRGAYGVVRGAAEGLGELAYSLSWVSIF